MSFSDEWNNESEYVVAHTSGSTGIPKEIHLAKELMRQSAQRTINALHLAPGGRLHLPLSTDYIAGKMMVVRARLLDAELTCEEPSNYILRNADHSRPIDLLAVVPSQLVDMLEHLDKLPVIHNIIVGGSAISPSLRRKLQLSGLNAYETYGMTETASHVALRHISQPETGPFKALPGIRFSLDIRGCLVIEYENNEWPSLATNDMARLIDHRSFILLGRYDNVIITGGKKVNPELLEQMIAPLMPENVVFFITSRPCEKWTNEIVLAIEAQSCCISDKEIEARLRQTGWPHHLLPKHIVRMQRLPRTSSGKLIRKTV